MQLRPYQQEAIQALWDYWRTAPHGRPLLSCPTGAGKSLILASVITEILNKYPKFRFLVVTHSKELVQQNALEFQKLSGILPAIYSAGLGQKNIAQVTFAGVQSLYKKPDALAFDMVIIDECHLISKNENSMYQKLLGAIEKNNPKLKIFGLTATPYRMDQGSLISSGSTFTDIAYDISVSKLISLKYLSPIISLPKESVDLKSVKTSGFDFNQIDLENAFNRQDLIKLHVEKIIEAGQNRKAWLVFCSGINHAREVSDELYKRGIAASYVTGEMPAFERDSIIKDFKNGKLQCLCNVGILTTGFNYPSVDLLALLRATKSTGLYIQMVGRGTRLAHNKTNCLVLDFGGNIERFGPIDCISVAKKQDKERVKLEVLPSKKCERCACTVAPRVLICPNCEWPFPDPTQRLEIAASNAPILNMPEVYEVLETTTKRHKKADKPDSFRIEYKVNDLKSFSEYLCFDHGGFATNTAKRKWVKLAETIPPNTVSEAVLRAHELKPIKSISVIKKNKYFEIVDFTYKTIEEVTKDQDFYNF